MSQRPLQVVHTIHDLALRHGGPSRSVPGLCAALGDTGIEATLISWVEEPGFPVLRTTEQVQIVHDHGVWHRSNVVSSRLARLKGAKHVVSPRGMLTQWALTQGAFKKRVAWLAYQRSVLQRADLIHVTAEAELEDVRRLGLSAPVAVVPNGVALAPPRPHRQKAAERSERTALFLSRIHPVKGLLDLVAAWNTVRPQGWRLTVAGPDDGGYQATVEAAVRRAGLQDVITFTGPASDADRWNLLDSANLFVLPSHSENFGVVVAEALSAGVPVITTTATPWAGLVTKDCGWWVPPTPEALAGALRHATQATDAERAEMGERACTWAQTFTHTQAARLVAEAYRWLLGQEARPTHVFPSHS